jgi:hypothetical protein
MKEQGDGCQYEEACGNITQARGFLGELSGPATRRSG